MRDKTCNFMLDFFPVNFLIDNPSSIFFLRLLYLVDTSDESPIPKAGLLNNFAKLNDRGRLLTGTLKTLAGKGLLLKYSIVDMDQI